MPKKAITRRVARLLKSEDIAKQQKGADIYKRRYEIIEANKTNKTNKANKNSIIKAIKNYVKKTGKDIGEQSPLNKKLVGNQHKLPEHLKAKIKAAPEMKGSPYTMYGQASSPLTSGSPLAKRGCTGRYKKS